MPEASEILSKLSITSHFKVSLDLARTSSNRSSTRLLRYLTDCGIFIGTRSTRESYDFLCSEASLPSSSFEMSEEMGSRQGTIERFATRRLYNEFDFTFYVDDKYNILRLFEEWMNFINPIYDNNGIYEGSPNGQLDSYGDRSDFFRFRYPDDYKRTISITKFERDFLRRPNSDRLLGNRFNNIPLLTYKFIDAFPNNINAVPLTYEGSSITQVSIGFSYMRHTVEKHRSESNAVIQGSFNF